MVSHRSSRKWQRNQHRHKWVRKADNGGRYWRPRRSGGRWVWQIPALEVAS